MSVDVQGRAPETSIVIRAFNEEKWLPSVLDAIKLQAYEDYEVLLVDSGSVDRTREIAQSYGARVVHVRPEDFTFGHSLNVGVEAARGIFVAIVSAHAIPTGPDWLRRLIEPLRREDVAIVYGGQQGHAVSKFSECQDFMRIFPARGKRIVTEKFFANNANSAIKRAFWDLHKFDEGLPGLEDIEWAKHWSDQGKSVVYEPDASVFHVHEESWTQVRRRYHREGIAARWVGIRSAKDTAREIAREIGWCAADLARAIGSLKLTVVPEILRFRYEKTIGTVGGILDGKSISNPARRAEMYYEKGFPAVVIRGPHNAAIEQRSIPVLRPGELLVRVAYQGICATDLEILEGSLGYYKNGIAHYPIVPGHECSGTVAAVGARVTDFRDGDRVVVECIQGCGHCSNCESDNAIACKERREVGVIGQDGGYAAYVVTRARYTHHVPKELSLAEAALAEPLAVVLKGLRRLSGYQQTPQPKRCAVIGAGAIGNLAARVLAMRGHAVTVFDREPSRLAAFNGNIQTRDVLEDLDQFEWLVEATGDQKALDTVLRGLGTGSTLLLLGLPYASTHFHFESLVGYDRAVIGSVGSGSRDFDEALEILAKLETSLFLQATYPLAEFESAWDEVRSKRHLKVMLHVDTRNA